MALAAIKFFIKNGVSTGIVAHVAVAQFRGGFRGVPVK